MSGPFDDLSKQMTAHLGGHDGFVVQLRQQESGKWKLIVSKSGTFTNMAKIASFAPDEMALSKALIIAKNTIEAWDDA